MRNIISLLCIIIVGSIVFPLNTAKGATIDNFSGVWEGYGKFTNNKWTGMVTLTLSVNNNSLSGRIIFENMGSSEITGIVTDGKLTFELPRFDSESPECANWDVLGTGTLDENLKTMELEISGIFCGEDGGKSDVLSATLLLIEEEQPKLLLIPVFIKASETSGSATISILNIGTGTMNWTATTDVSWLIVESVNSGTNNQAITINHTANFENIPRIGIIAITALGAKNSPQTVVIEQSANSAIDIDNNGTVDLQDAILALKISTGFSVSNINPDADVNGDRKIGIEKVIYILRKLAEMK